MAGIPRLSPAEAYEKMTRESWVYLDVRTEDEFAEGHPEGAFNVPLQLEDGDSNPAFRRVVEATFTKDTPLVIGCRMGLRSAHAAELLADAGFARVADQRAGWDGVRGVFGEILDPGWARLGLPRESGQPEGRAYVTLGARGRLVTNAIA